MSKALTGQLQTTSPDDDPWSRRSHKRRKRDEEKEPSVERAIQAIAMGFGFILVAFGALFYAPAGHLWWFWMFIPAFASLGKGVAEYMRWKHAPLPAQQPVNQLNQPQVGLPPTPVAAFPPRNTGEVYTPPSVTEQTTRNLDPAAQRSKDQS